LAVTDWRLRRWRLWFLARMTATRKENEKYCVRDPFNATNQTHKKIEIFSFFCHFSSEQRSFLGCTLFHDSSDPLGTALK